MGTKVKGFLKGLRYFSHIFDEKDNEIHIGFPTDVKHVAHIGWDGPSANQPSWMNEFKGSEASSMVDANEVLSSPGSMKTASESSVRNVSEELVVRNEIPKARRKYSSTNSSSGSPKRGSDGSKNYRRRTKVKDNSSDSATQESSGTTRGLSGLSKNSRRNRIADGSNDSKEQHCGDTRGSSDGSKQSTRSRSDDDAADSSKPSSRRNRYADASNDSQTKDSSNNTRRSKTTNPGSESPSQDHPVVPKQSQRKKLDGSSEGKPSKSKEQGSLTDIRLDNGSVAESKTM